MEEQGNRTWMQNVENVARAVPVVGSLNGSKKRVYRALSGVSFQGLDAQQSSQPPAGISCDQGQAYAANTYSNPFQSRFEGPCSLENNPDNYGMAKSRNRFFSLGRNNGKHVAAGMPDSLEDDYPAMYPAMVPQQYAAQQDYYNNYSSPRYSHGQQNYYYPSIPPQNMPVVHPQSQQNWNQQNNYQPIMSAPYPHIPRHQQHLQQTDMPPMYAQSQQNFCYPPQMQGMQNSYGNNYYTQMKSAYDVPHLKSTFEHQHPGVKNDRILSADSLEKLPLSPSNSLNISATEASPKHKDIDRVDSVESNCERDSLEDVRPRHFRDIKSFFENKSSTSSISQVHRSLSSCEESVEKQDTPESVMRKRYNSDSIEREDSGKTYIPSKQDIKVEEFVPFTKSSTPKCSKENIPSAFMSSMLDSNDSSKKDLNAKTNKPEKCHIGDVKFLRATKDTPQTILASARLVRATMKTPLNPTSFYIALDSKFQMPEFKGPPEDKNKDSKPTEDKCNSDKNTGDKIKKDVSPADYLESQLQLQHYVKDWADASFSSDSECDEFFLVLDSTDYTQPLINESIKESDVCESEVVLHDVQNDSDKTDECSSPVSTSTKSDENIADLPSELPKTAANKEDFLDDKPTLKISEHFLELGKGIDTDITGDFTLANRKLKILTNTSSNEDYIDQSNRKLIFLKVNVGKPVTGVGKSYDSLLYFELSGELKPCQFNIMPSTSIQYLPVTIRAVTPYSNYAKLVLAELTNSDVTSSYTLLHNFNDTFFDNCCDQSSLPLAKRDLETIAAMITKHLNSSTSSILVSKCDASNSTASVGLNSDITRKYFANMEDSEFRCKIANYNRNIHQFRTNVAVNMDSNIDTECTPTLHILDKCDSISNEVQSDSFTDERKISESSGVSSLSETEIHGFTAPTENMYTSKSNSSYVEDWKWISNANRRRRESFEGKQFKRQDSSFSNSSYQSSGVSSAGSDFPDCELQLCNSGVSLLSNIEEEFKNGNSDNDDVNSLTISVNGDSLLLPIPVWPSTDSGKYPTGKDTNNSGINKVDSYGWPASGNRFKTANHLGNRKNASNAHRLRRKTIHVFENIPYNQFHPPDMVPSSKTDSSSSSSESSSTDDLVSMRGLFDSSETMQSIASEIMPIFIDQVGSNDSVRHGICKSSYNDLFRIASDSSNFKIASKYSPKLMQKLPLADSKSLPNLSDIGEANILDEINSRNSKNSLTLEESEFAINLGKPILQNCETQIVTHVFADETTDDEYSLTSDSEHYSDMEDLNFELFEPRAWTGIEKYSSFDYPRKSHKLSQLRRKFSFNSSEKSKELKETFVSSLQRIKMAKHKIDKMVQKTLKSEGKSAKGGVKEIETEADSQVHRPHEIQVTQLDRHSRGNESDDDTSLYSWSDADSDFEYMNLRPNNVDESNQTIKIAEPPRHNMEPSFSKELWRKILHKKFHPFKKGTLSIEFWPVCEYLEELEPVVGPFQHYLVAY